MQHHNSNNKKMKKQGIKSRVEKQISIMHDAGLPKLYSRNMVKGNRKKQQTTTIVMLNNKKTRRIKRN